MAQLLGFNGGKELRELVKRAGFKSDFEFAKAAGYARQSSVQRYLDPDEFEGKYLPLNFIEKAAEALVGRGDPPIAPEDVYSLANVAPLPYGNRYTLPPDTSATTPSGLGEEKPPRLVSSKKPHNSAESVVESGRAPLDTHGLVMIPEIDVHAPAGSGGGLMEVMEGDDAVVRGKYGFPEQGFREQFGAQPTEVVVVEVVGDSMLPTLRPGERVLVHLKSTAPSPPGIFMVWDGLGQVMKRVEYIPHSEPPTVKISSDNKTYEPYTRELGEAYIQGRVIGHWERM